MRKKKTNQKVASKSKSKLLDEKMYQTYYDAKHVASYGGKNRLQQLYSRKDVNRWAPTQLAYSLHKPLRKKFPTRSYRVAGMNELWQMDLMEMIPYASVNNGNRYILVCIDVFSRFVRAVPCKTKSGEEVSTKMAKMFERVTPRKIQTDKGKEFYNSHVSKLLAKHNIGHYTVNSQFKAAIVERFNRTLREKFNRYFTHTGKKQWVNILPDIIDTYNKSKHRGIFNLTPGSITQENETQLWHMQENQVKSKDDKAIDVMSLVRISKISTSNPFNKNFDQNWSDEVFRIVGVDTRTNPYMYILEDYDGNVIDGKFYKSELQVIPEKPDVYRIEKILESKGRGEHKQHLVKWHGYTEPTWIKASQIVQHE